MPAPSHQAGPLHKLRSEIPCFVALLAEGKDFAGMQQYSTFPFDDYTAYAHHMQEALRSLDVQGIPIHVGLFSPDEYAPYCADAGLDADTVSSRARYTAVVAVAGPTVVYAGQPVDYLITQLVIETNRQATWERATELLDRAAKESTLEDAQITTEASFARASQAITALLKSLGPGHHHLACSVHPDEAPLVAALHADFDDENVSLSEDDALVFSAALAAGFALGIPGGIVARTSSRDDSGSETVRAWSLRDGWLRPLTEAEVFNAYCTRPGTGEPVPPEPGVAYCAGTVIPLPDS